MRLYTAQAASVSRSVLIPRSQDTIWFHLTTVWVASYSTPYRPNAPNGKIKNLTPQALGTNLFIRESNQHYLFIIRCGVTYGQVFHGKNLSGKASRTLDQNKNYRDSILIGQPVIDAHSNPHLWSVFSILVIPVEGAPFTLAFGLRDARIQEIADYLNPPANYCKK